MRLHELSQMVCSSFRKTGNVLNAVGLATKRLYPFILTTLLLCGLLLLGTLLVRVPTASTQTSTARFAVIGDYGNDSPAERDVAALVKSWNPDFIITVGDNNYPDGSAFSIDRKIGQYYHDFIFPYTGTYGQGATNNRFFPSLGNHDWHAEGAQPYLDYFVLPNNERYYDFVWGPVHFFAIDSDPNEPDGITSNSVQADWLKARLAASTEAWKLVYFHHPPFSSSSKHGPTEKLQWPFKEWGATAVLAGHDHIYERIIVENFPYFVNGLGGAGQYQIGEPVAGSQIRYNADFGAMLVEAGADRITFQFINRQGELIDNYTITKSEADQIPAAPGGLTASNITDVQITLTWTDNSANEDGFKIERCQGSACSDFRQVGQVGPNVAAYNDTGLATSSTYSYRVRAFSAAGDSQYSNTLEATTKAVPVSPPDAPGDLKAVADSSNQIDLSWRDTSANEDGFKVERCQLAGCSNFVQIAQLAANATAYADEGRDANTTYTYRLRGFNSIGDSAYSNTSTATTTEVASGTTFSDDFDDGTEDGSKWSLGLLSRSSTSFDPQVQVIERDGLLSIAVVPGTVKPSYSGYVSVPTFDMIGGLASVELAQKADNKAATIFTIGTDKDNWFSFRVKGNTLYMESRVDGSTARDYLNYDSTAHRFLRLRHDRSSDAVLFEASADGNSWAQLHSVSRQIAIAAIRIELVAGAPGTVDTPSTALFDNLRFESPTAQ